MASEKRERHEAPADAPTHGGMWGARTAHLCPSTLGLIAPPPVSQTRRKIEQAASLAGIVRRVGRKCLFRSSVRRVTGVMPRSMTGASPRARQD